MSTFVNQPNLEYLVDWNKLHKYFSFIFFGIDDSREDLFPLNSSR